MIQKILKTIRLIYETILFGAKEGGEKIKPYATLYIKGLLFLALIVIFSPIPFLIIGILGDWRWLIALTGLWWAFWTFLLLLASSPIGILIESLIGGIKGSGQRFVKWVSGILLTGLGISLFASIIPIRTNLAMLPMLIVAAIILGILNVWLFSRKVITPLVSIIFITLILSFFFPTTFETLGKKISDIDISVREPKRLYITYESLEKGEAKFFDPDGRPKVWYYRGEDGRFELFNRKGRHPIFGDELQLVTPDVVPQITKQLKIEVERKFQEEQRRQEEVQRIQRQKKEEVEKIAREKQKEAEKIAEQRREEAMLPKHTIKREYKPPVFVGNSLYDKSFRIEIISVERVDESKLKFGILIRSLIKEYSVVAMGLEEPETTAYIVDPDGNRYFFVDQENMVGNFPSDIDVRGSITFIAPPTTVKRISLIFQFSVGLGFAADVIFRNLDLDTLKLTN